MRSSREQLPLQDCTTTESPYITDRIFLEHRDQFVVLHEDTTVCRLPVTATYGLVSSNHTGYFGFLQSCFWDDTVQGFPAHWHVRYRYDVVQEFQLMVLTTRRFRFVGGCIHLPVVIMNHNVHYSMNATFVLFIADLYFSTTFSWVRVQLCIYAGRDASTKTTWYHFFQIPHKKKQRLSCHSYNVVIQGTASIKVG